MQKGHLHLVCFSNRISQSYTLYSKLILSYYSTLVMKKQWVHRNIIHIICVCLVAQSCPTLSNPIDCNPPGSSVHGIFQARILDWVAISFSRGPSWPRNQTHVSCTAGRFFTTEPPGKTRWRVKTGNFQLNYSDANLPNTTVQLSQLPFKITFALTRYKSPFPPLKVG